VEERLFMTIVCWSISFQLFLLVLDGQD
jgi:hypothetical protein